MSLFMEKVSRGSGKAPEGSQKGSRGRPPPKAPPQSTSTHGVTAQPLLRRREPAGKRVSEKRCFSASQ
ncbi:hypothetical protein M885DRAFT_508121 [Pelagophyceae sp. CCMP2097]|nr:hypothetical protein M885DRAFT_508121 [Pelagophyceae sp. CCMP2097]